MPAPSPRTRQAVGYTHPPPFSGVVSQKQVSAVMSCRREARCSRRESGEQRLEAQCRRIAVVDPRWLARRLQRDRLPKPSIRRTHYAGQPDGRPGHASVSIVATIQMQQTWSVVSSPKGVSHRDTYCTGASQRRRERGLRPIAMRIKNGRVSGVEVQVDSRRGERDRRDSARPHAWRYRMPAPHAECRRGRDPVSAVTDTKS